MQIINKTTSNMDNTNIESEESKKVTWIATFAVFGHYSKEELKSLQKLLEFILDYIEDDNDSAYLYSKVIKEYEKRIKNYFPKIKEVYKPVAKHMLLAQLENPKETSIVQLTQAINDLDYLISNYYLTNTLDYGSKLDFIITELNNI